MKHLNAISILFLLLLSCNESENTDPKFIIEGYVFAGEPVNNITIKEQTGIDEPDSIKRLISNAKVVLIKEDKEYQLQYEDEKYRYFGNDLSIESEDELRLEATVGDRTAFAETIVPDPTVGLTISDTKMIIPEIKLSFNVQAELTELFFKERLTTRWENPNDELHFIVIEPVVVEFDSIFPTGFPQSGIDFLSSFKFAPEASKVDTFSIIGIAFETYGKHRAKVYKVNQEYADLFNNPEQDSRDLTSPPTNVVNGFGIFSAFAADSVFFDIVRE
jgi:hypothetical protein